MTSKGVDLCVYINGVNFDLTASKYDAGSSTPSFNKTYQPCSYFKFDSFEVNSNLPYYEGIFKWSVGSQPLFNRTAKINTVTGNMSGDFSDMMNTPSIINDDSAISYGFYDAGSGFGGLTNRDQNYVYITPSVKNWMGDLTKAHPKILSSPFYNFTLPGSHDSGSFDVSVINKLLFATSAGVSLSFISYFATAIGVALTALTVLSAPAIRRLMIKLCVTQKDDIPTQLNLGCRYFDFRPGKLPSPLSVVDDEFRHIHNFLPGYSLTSFLTDIFGWLAANPTEIVVVSLNTQGINDAFTTPTAADLESILSTVKSRYAGIETGDASDLAETYQELISGNKRLIFLNQIADWHVAPKYDSYSGDAYNTLNPNDVLNALDLITPTAPEGDAYTVLQLQGTASAAINIPGYISQFLSLSDSSSLLMSTKLKFDSYIYHWVESYAAKKSPRNMPLVLLNDFIDNRLALIASRVTLQRSREYFLIESVQFPNVFLQISTLGSDYNTAAGFGRVNAQFGIPGTCGYFSIEKDASGNCAIYSLSFPDVLLRMDGGGISDFIPAGGGVVNCQYAPPGAYGKFKLIQNPDDTFSIGSVQFDNIYLRLDATNVKAFFPNGVGTVNCQYSIGPWEKFKITKVSDISN